jgi:ubiquitin C-terminal hydrolase
MSQKDELTEKFFFVDLGNFVQISFNNKCFYCQNNLGIIPCEECSINSFNNITYLFCSTACLTKHINNYHNQICVYQTFQYNKTILLKTTSNKENGISVGLHNLGNTCFMNAVLQCLLHCDAFINYFIHEQYKREPLNSKNDQAITNSFVSFITGMIKNNRALYQSQGYNGMHTYNPSGLRKEILKKESKYNNNRQHDALEFFSDFLDLLSKEVNRSNSTIYDTKKIR